MLVQLLYVSFIAFPEYAVGPLGKGRQSSEEICPFLLDPGTPGAFAILSDIYL